MFFTRMLTKLPYLLLLTILLYYANIYLNHKIQLTDDLWHYYVPHQEFQTHQQHNFLSALQLQHDGEGLYQPIDITIKTKYNQDKQFVIDDLNHTHIDEKLDIRKHQIKHAIIKSNHPLNFHQKQKVRLLESVTINDIFVIVSGKFFSVFLPAVRNLMILGILTNQVDTFLPLVITSQSVMMLAFLDNQKHYLSDFYKSIFSSNLDFFNIIRLKIFATNSSLKGNSLITYYGFSNNLFYNISGQFTVTLIFLMITIFIKAGAALLKFQKLRSVNSKLRGIWNGYLFCLMPRILTFSSFSIRQMTFDSFQGAFYPIIAIAFFIVYLIYFVQLFLQIKKINQKVEYLEKSKNQIGLVSRLDYKHDFEFDCLEYSNLYYPIMNFLRLLIFFIPIGASYDFTYMSFGGVIISQLFYIMFTVSSSGYIKGRDSLVYPLCDFLIMLLQLAHIAVGLAQSVLHSQVSVIAQKVFFSLLLAIILMMTCSVAADLSSKIKQSCTNKSEQQMNNYDKDLKTTKFKRAFKKQVSKQQMKTTVKTRKGQVEDISNDQSNHDSDNQSALNIKRTMTHVKPKVRKVRQGKLI